MADVPVIVTFTVKKNDRTSTTNDLKDASALIKVTEKILARQNVPRG